MFSNFGGAGDAMFGLLACRHKNPAKRISSHKPTPSCHFAHIPCCTCPDHCREERMIGRDNNPEGTSNDPLLPTLWAPKSIVSPGSLLDQSRVPCSKAGPTALRRQGQKRDPHRSLDGQGSHYQGSGDARFFFFLVLAHTPCLHSETNCC